MIVGCPQPQSGVAAVRAGVSWWRTAMNTEPIEPSTGAPEIAGWLSVESAAPDAGLPAASRPPTLFPRGEDTMPAEATRAADDPWRDVDGVSISMFCWVEQVAEHPEHGALFSRLYQRGEVAGRGQNQVYVRFEGQTKLISLPPHVLRLLPETPGQC